MMGMYAWLCNRLRFGERRFPEMMKRMGVLVVLLLVAVIVAGCGESADKGASQGRMALRLATMTSLEHTYNQGGLRFAELVKERSSGRIQIALFPGGQLGKGERELLEALQRGSIDFYVGSTGPIAGFSPSIGILDLPFLFRDYAHADKVLDGPIGRQLLDDMAKADLKALAFWENGFRNLTNSKKAVRIPADVRGLKIRTMENRVHLAAWKAAGAIPVPMAWGEVYGALQQRAIDGQENPVAVVHASKFVEVQKFLSLTRHVYSPAVIIASPRTWQKFSPEDREMIIKTALEVAPYDRRLGRNTEEEQLAELAAKGMIVIRDVDKAAWHKAMQGVMDEFAAAFGKDKVDTIIHTR